MAHRIYLFNFDQKTRQIYKPYLGEWNYEIPLLLYPLLAEQIALKGVEFICDRQQGIVQLRYFFNLLADHYQLHYKKAYYESVNTMFEFLEALPYDSLICNATDVFNMNEEEHQVQAKEWLQEIQHIAKRYKKAVKTQNLALLDPLLSQTAYASFLEILQTDWINYGLGYFEKLAYKKVSSTVFEEEGKYGLKDAQGSILAPAIYDDISEGDPTYSISTVQKSELFGYLQSDGKLWIPTIYESAFEVFHFGLEPLGQVRYKGKLGVLKLHTHRWLIPAEYDAIERIACGFFAVEKRGKYGVFSAERGVICPVSSDRPVEFDYGADLFFVKLKDSKSCRYYNKEGSVLGDFLEGSIAKALSGFWIKPNKRNSNGMLIDSKGRVISSEVDQLLLIDNFHTLAVRQANSWKIYCSKTQQFLLVDSCVIRVKALSNSGFKPDIYIVTTKLGLGLYDASEAAWIIPPQTEISKIRDLDHGFLSIQVGAGFQFFDFESGLSTRVFDYISNPLNYRTAEGMLFLYSGDRMFRMHEDKSIHQLDARECESVALDRFSFRGKDLDYFNNFYWNR